MPSGAKGAKTDSKPAISGYLQMELRQGVAKSGVTLPEHELNVRRARVTFAGKISSRVSYSATVQGDGTNANSASLLDVSAYVSLTPWAAVRVGQYKYEFDIEGRESDAANPIIDRSFATNAVAGSLNGASTASSAASSHRDRGVSLVGSTKGAGLKWGYGVGLFQGAGRASDNNNAFSVTANGNVEPLPGLKLNVGVLTSDAADRGAAARNKYTAWTLGAIFDRGRLFARSEYYQGRRDRQSGNQDLNGYYLLGSVTPLASLDLMVRYQRMTDEQYGPSDNAARSVDLSAKLYFDRRARRSGTYLSLTYMLRKADDAFKKGLTLLNDGRGAALDNGALVGNVLAARLQVAF
jgi:hypothetical protein